MEIELDIST